MAKPKSKVPCSRFRISVPDNDKLVLEWIDAQVSISSSIRMLIKEDVARNGMGDVTCRSYCQYPASTVSASRQVVDTGSLQRTVLHAVDDGSVVESPVSLEESYRKPVSASVPVWERDNNDDGVGDMVDEGLADSDDDFDGIQMMDAMLSRQNNDSGSKDSTRDAVFQILRK